MARILKNGEGWRLGWNPEAPIYQGLIGSEDWAMELTAVEFHDFRRLLVQLHGAIAQIAPELMDEEQLQCEVESEWLWLEAFGSPKAYSVRVILNQGRGVEGTWPSEVVPPLLQAVESFDVF